MLNRIVFILSVIYCCLSTSITAEDSSKVSIPDSLQNLLVMFKPILQQLIDTKVPASIGNCAAGAPEPCQEQGDLFKLKEFFYTAKARWIGGLDTAKLKGIQVGSLDDTTVGVYLEITLDDIPVDLRIEGCLFKCFKLIDDSKSCCGSNKTIRALVAFDCATSTPYLTNLDVRYIDIFPSIYIRPRDKIDLIHVTKMIEDNLKKQIESRITPDMVLLANSYISGLLGSGDFTCKSLNDDNNAQRRRLLKLSSESRSSLRN